MEGGAWHLNRLDVLLCPNKGTEEKVKLAWLGGTFIVYNRT